MSKRAHEEHAVTERTLGWNLETQVFLLALSLLFVQHWEHCLMFS